jgi:hypothetical protein
MFIWFRSLLIVPACFSGRSTFVASAAHAIAGAAKLFLFSRQIALGNENE